jgi:hypothetical protein
MAVRTAIAISRINFKVLFIVINKVLRLLEPPPAPPKEGRRGDRIFMGEHVMLGKQSLILI